MISIDVVEINDKVVELKKIIEDYNLVYLNLFNNINQLSESWIGSDASKFFTSIEKEKRESSELIERLKIQKDIYKYLYESYKEIGNKIKCNLDVKDVVIAKINNCIDKTKELCNLYKSIIILNNYEEKENIQINYKYTIHVLNKYNELKENIKNTYTRIEEIEQEVNKKLENIEIIKSNEFDINYM